MDLAAMYTNNQFFYFGMTVLVIIALPCLLILIFVVCYIFGLTTGAIIRIFLKPSKQSNDTGTEDQQKLMNYYNSEAEENSEYGTLSPGKGLHNRSPSTESNLSLIRSNEDLQKHLEKSIHKLSKESITKYHRPRKSNDEVPLVSNEHQKDKPHQSSQRAGFLKTKFSESSQTFDGENDNQERRSSKQSKSTSDTSVKSLLSPYEHFAEYYHTYSAAQNAALSILLSTKESDWIPIKEPGPDIIEYIETNKKKTYLLKAIVDARPDVISRIVFDLIDEVHLWSPKLTMHCTMLKIVNLNTHIVHSIITPGKVMKPRDFVLLNHRANMVVLGRDSIVISTTSVDFDCPHLQSQHRGTLVRYSR
ncbi:uncharacterized protein LOC111044684 isoform X2 [Nilaparvata lugens]|uniref:uncharacterized protein LOC111044684 isoform X2 n=1 Tax=Nilaparvata lugens TaxID=108931 RepID=UPI00193E884B|nr:uncharacterized protein LOC111044684 isoform X2 [Nilaparvata lugens]